MESRRTTHVNRERCDLQFSSHFCNSDSGGATAEESGALALGLGEEDDQMHGVSRKLVSVVRLRVDLLPVRKLILKIRFFLEYRHLY